MRLVLDTDVIVAAIRSNTGASRQLLIDALRRRFDLLLSVPLMLEYEAVLKRREHMAAARATRRDIDTILDALGAIATPIGFEFSWRPELADPADEMVLETAVNGVADVIVTFNVAHLGRAARRFGILAMRPAKALEHLEK